MRSGVLRKKSFYFNLEDGTNLTSRCVCSLARSLGVSLQEVNATPVRFISDLLVEDTWSHVFMDTLAPRGFVKVRHHHGSRPHPSGRSLENLRLLNPAGSFTLRSTSLNTRSSLSLHHISLLLPDTGMLCKNPSSPFGAAL